MIVPDTSVIIEGSEVFKKLNPDKILIHEAVLAELEHQANEGKAIGNIGLKVISDLRKDFTIDFAGERPRHEIKYASLGEIDAMIRKLAYDEDATLVTADKVQAKVAEAKGIKVHFVKREKKSSKLKLEKYFDDKTMSVHLKEKVKAIAKKGEPGNWKFVSTGSKLKQEEIKEMSTEIIEEARKRDDSFVEIERGGSTIIQLGRFRIVITFPPFSDGWEITAVRPVKQMKLEDYNLSEKLFKRICEQAEGILIAGSPGMGKSTFAAALTSHYASQGKIVKTIEAPRDLVLPDEVTQLAISHGTPEEVHDILLLSRPDYTLFDEMRNTEDFSLYADLRLAGIGLAGVVHGTSPVDAIQRFIGRIEMGVIPQVIDTVIFIKNGIVFKVLSLQMEVKVPAGMTEADLARPVVVIKDFETNSPEYEVYSYGEETVLIPIKAAKKVEKGVSKLAKEAIIKRMGKYAQNMEVEIASPEKAIVYVPENAIARIIGKQGKHIEEIEKDLGIGLDIRALEQTGEGIKFKLTEDKRNVVFSLGKKMKNKDVMIYADSDLLTTATAGKSGVVKIKKKSPIGEKLYSCMRKSGSIVVQER